MTNEHFSKIICNLKDNWHGYQTETLWGKHVGDGMYIIDNIPFFSTEVSLGDTVQVIEKQGVLFLDAVVDRGGHSTYRVVLQKEAREYEALSLLDQMEKFGGDYEKGLDGLFAVDVNSLGNVSAIYDLLEKGEKALVWDFEEGCYQHKPLQNRIN